MTSCDVRCQSLIPINCFLLFLLELENSPGESVFPSFLDLSENIEKHMDKHLDWDKIYSKHYFGVRFYLYEYARSEQEFVCHRQLKYRALRGLRQQILSGLITLIKRWRR